MSSEKKQVSERKRILCINGNRELFPAPVLPLGLCKTASALKEKGHKVDVLDLCFQKNPEGFLRSFLQSEEKYDLFCIGIRNLDNADMLNTRPLLPPVQRMIAVLRGCFPRVPVVVGGAAVNVIGKDLLNILDVHALFIGEGECLPEYIDMLTALPADAKEVIAPEPLEDIDAYPDADIGSWISLRPYLSLDTPYPVQTKRGCSFKCSYCTYFHIEGTHYRLRSVERIAQEIENAYTQHGVRCFEFVDSVFNVPRDFAFTLCKRLQQLPEKITFIAGGSNPVGFDEEFLQLLEASRFIALSFTVESGSETMLKSYNKGFDTEKLKESAGILRRAKMPVMWIFLMGGKNETMQTVEETLGFIHDHIRAKDVAYSNIGIRLYPHTALLEDAKEEGRIREENTVQLLDPFFYFSPELNKEELIKRLSRFSLTHPNFIFSAEVDGKAVLLGYKLVSLLRLPKPAWRYSPYFNRLKNCFRQKL